MQGRHMGAVVSFPRCIEGLDLVGGWRDPFVFEESGDGPVDWENLGLPEDAVVFSTSGSTGGKTHVVHTLGVLKKAARVVIDWLSLREEDVFLCPLPLMHVGGFGMWLRARLCGARFVAFTGRWDAAEFVRRSREEEATVASLVPTQVHDIVRAGLSCPPGLRCVIVGGGHFLSALESESRQLCWPVLGSFGMTETCGQIATDRPDLADPGPGWLPVIEGWEARTGKHGILETRGPGLLAGRVKNVNGKWRYLPTRLDDGWLATEDRAAIREFGGQTWLRPQGRRDDAIKIRGELVWLSAVAVEIEGLSRGLGLASNSVAIIDQPDFRTGAKLVLVGEPDARERLPVLVDEFNRRAPAYARIEHAVVIENIPRSALGKLRRSSLRALLTEFHI